MKECRIYKGVVMLKEFQGSDRLKSQSPKLYSRISSKPEDLEPVPALQLRNSGEKLSFSSLTEGVLTHYVEKILIN